MYLSGLTAPNLPNGDHEDKDLGIIILMKDGQGIGVKQTDGSYLPFPYEFDILSGDPVGNSKNAQRLTDEQVAAALPAPQPPATIWGIPVHFSKLDFAPTKENELPPGNWIMGIDPAAWPESMGIDFARPGSDQTSISLVSGELDTTLLSIIEGGQSDSVSMSINEPLEIPEPDDFQEVTVDINPPGGLGSAREFMERFWEPEPSNARLLYRPGDKVKLIRKDLYGWVPVGALGVVQSIEHPESHMASKGKHYSISFDLSPFKIKIDETMREMMRRALPAGKPIPEYHEIVTTCVGVRDIEMVEKGTNWNPDYKHPFNEDSILEAMEAMTPDEWQAHLDRISNNIDRQLRAERHPFGNLRAEDTGRREMLNAHRAATEMRGDDMPEFIRPPFIPDYILKGTVDRYTRDFFLGQRPEPRPEPRRATFLSDDYLDGTLPPRIFDDRTGKEIILPPEDGGQFQLPPPAFPSLPPPDHTEPTPFDDPANNLELPDSE